MIWLNATVKLGDSIKINKTDEITKYNKTSDIIRRYNKTTKTTKRLILQNKLHNKTDD